MSAKTVAINCIVIISKCAANLRVFAHATCRFSHGLAHIGVLFTNFPPENCLLDTKKICCLYSVLLKHKLGYI